MREKARECMGVCKRESACEIKRFYMLGGGVRERKFKTERQRERKRKRCTEKDMCRDKERERERRADKERYVRNGKEDI